MHGSFFFYSAFCCSVFTFFFTFKKSLNLRLITDKINRFLRLNESGGGTPFFPALTLSAVLSTQPHLLRPTVGTSPKGVIHDHYFLITVAEPRRSVQLPCVRPWSKKEQPRNGTEINRFAASRKTRKPSRRSQRNCKATSFFFGRIFSTLKSRAEIRGKNKH